jgi:predicted dehydrogenase
MTTVLVIGAGSIGNHLAFACRQKGWKVDLYDNDPEALQRTQQDIYPSRYGRWDNEVRLLADQSFKPEYDLVIIGTPPDTHLSIASKLARDLNIRFMLIEKPLCGPDLQGLKALRDQLESTGCLALVGYNHIFCQNTKVAKDLISNEAFGVPLSLHVRWLEHWGGIFAAHPWLPGPEASYLGHWRRGGGACGEHSHAISLWQHFSNVLGQGDITEVSASMKIVEANGVCYDETAQTLVRSDRGLIGSIIQDVVTAPAEKKMRIQFENGFLEWEANADPSHDAVRFACQGKPQEVRLIKKTRPDDFRGQIDHIEDLLSGRTKAEASPNALSRGISVMQVVSAAYESSSSGASVQIPKSL